jgi:hypothetical protein
MNSERVSARPPTKEAPVEIDRGRPRPRSYDEAALWQPHYAAKFLGVPVDRLWKWARDPASGLEVVGVRGQRYLSQDSVRRLAARIDSEVRSRRARFIGWKQRKRGPVPSMWARDWA